MKRLDLILSACLTCFLITLATAAPASKITLPDFTKGDEIPRGADHDWNLGATGARGWIYCDKMVTSDARQIRITEVAKGSPADGLLAVGDVLLGVDGNLFSYDPRTEMGKALVQAEAKGPLTLLRWRGGEQSTVTLPLPVLGNYSTTAPYDCPKSKRILELGCQNLAQRMADPGYRQNPIPRSLNALALLASGNSDYLPLVRKEVEWAAGFSDKGFQTWYYGYVMMLIAEYTISTGDQDFLPGLRRLALDSAKGQSAVGSWGHRFAGNDRRLGGYGMMNAPGIPLTTALYTAYAAGVKDQAVTDAINRSTRLLRFYEGKGAIPYGDHAPWIETHEDNGKCGMAAILFNLLKEPDTAQFFSRMSVASHGPERDGGHTGNFWNILWSLPGVAQSGPRATGAWMQEFGAWYFDLARRADGSFVHQGPPEPRKDSYANWDATGAYLLSYALPLKKILLTGKQPSSIPVIDAATAQKLILDGRGWDNKDRNSAYDQLNGDVLLDALTSWSPVVRERAAMALGRRKDVSIDPLLKMLDSSALEAQIGACQAITFLRGRGAPAVEALGRCLKSEDLWLRIKAAEALAAIGKPAMSQASELLKLLTQVDRAKDPRGMQQRYLSFALFNNRGGMLSKSLEGVDRKVLFEAVKAGLKNEDGRARGSIGSVYRNLTFAEITPLLPAILEAVETPAPSGIMFADEIRVEGLRILATHKVSKGIPACVEYIATQNKWASEKRTPELLKILLTYGVHGKAVLPKLEEIAASFDEGEEKFPKKLSLEKAQMIRDAIKAIKSSTGNPKLIRVN
ncbi:DUF6288 domain-containing protein [Verrucomicrobiaceae bacterium 227]